MRFRWELAWSIAFQSGGAAAVFLAVFVIGLVLGPAAQGEFSRYKAETEFAAAFGMLGLPQALFFFTKSGALAAERAARIAKLGALLCAPIALVYGFLNSSWLNGASCVAFALAVTMMIWQGNLRGVVLARSTVRQFNFITALPQMLLLTYAFAAVAFGRVRNLDMGLAFAIAFGMGTLIGTGALRATCAARQESWISSVRIGEVATYGLASGLTTVAATMATLVAIRAVQSRFSAAELGIFAFGSVLVQGALTPLNYSIPLLFKRRMERPSAVGHLRVGLVAAIAFLVLAVFVLLLSREAGLLLWLGTYKKLPSILWILLLGAGADAIEKILAVDANATGRPWLPVIAESGRLLVVAGAVTFMGLVGVSGVAWIVTVAAALAAVTLVVLSMVTTPNVQVLP